MKKLVTTVLAAAMALSSFAAVSAEEVQDLPRNETLYFGGQQWGSVIGWNPLSSNMNNAMALAAAPRGSQIQTEGEKDQQDHDQNTAFHG